jgi:hypothetical protein
MMGGWLARLKNQNTPDTPATKPTKPPLGDEKAGFVGFVAYPPTPFQKIGAVDSVAVKSEAPAANDCPPSAIAPVTDPDRWCWPHSVAWNSKEIDTFTARLARFTDKGVSYDEAERLADALVIRDREGDDRRLCLECPHLQGFGRWRCGNWQAADVARQGLARDLVLMLQRCGGFAARRESIER